MPYGTLFIDGAPWDTMSKSKTVKVLIYNLDRATPFVGENKPFANKSQLTNRALDDLLVKLESGEAQKN